MRWWLQASDEERAESPLFGAATGCERFEQRLLRFDAASGERGSSGDDELLYVLTGAGTATIDGERHEFRPGAAAWIGAGASWRVERADALRLLSVLVRDPEPGGDAGHAVVAAGAREGATAGREFTLLATPEVGCASATQFVGIVPVGRAPDHFHPYDEVVYVLEGRGALHVDGESRPLRPGACVHLPARLVHCLENEGPGEMRLLGVFRPAGSPAEAYYPDGAAAAVPEPS